jgi:hypothetical protein
MRVFLRDAAADTRQRAATQRVAAPRLAQGPAKRPERRAREIGGAQRRAPLRLEGVNDADASETRSATELADRRGGWRLEEIEGRVVVDEKRGAPMFDPDPIASERGGSTRDARPIRSVRS